MDPDEAISAYPVLKGVEHRVTMLCFAWHEFKALFATNDERIKTLNDVAGGFFATLHGILVDNILLQLAVLADPARDRKCENLSFARLLEEAEPQLAANPTTRAKVDGLLSQYSLECTGIKAHRNKRIAHADAATFANIMPLDGVPFTTVRHAIEIAFELLNTVRLAMIEDEASFDRPIILGDAECLLHALESSQRFMKMRLWLYSQPVEEMKGGDVRQQLISTFFEMGDKVAAKRA